MKTSSPNAPQRSNNRVLPIGSVELTKNSTWVSKVRMVAIDVGLFAIRGVACLRPESVVALWWGILKGPSGQECCMAKFHKLFQLAALTAAAAIVIAATQDIGLVQGESTPEQGLAKTKAQVS